MEPAEPVGDQKDRVLVKRKTLQAVLKQCELALQQLAADYDDDDDKDDNANCEVDIPEGSSNTPASCETDTTEYYDLQSRVEGTDFIEKIKKAQESLSKSPIDAGEDSWDVVSKNDLFDGENVEFNLEDYVVVGEEDIVDGIASYMAVYLLSLDHTKDLTPKQLQAALSKTFSVKKEKGKIQKVWDESKKMYTLVSWGATAVGVYQNPTLCKAASCAFWTTCRVIKKMI